MKKMTNRPHWQRMLWLSAFPFLLLLLLAVSQFVGPILGTRVQSAQAATTRWVGTWGAAPVVGLPVTGLSTATFRNVVHTSVAGSSVRIQFSNAFGTQPVLIWKATVALPVVKGSAAAQSGTMKVLAFAGKHSIIIPTGQQVYSDPLAFSAPADSDLLVTAYTPHASGLVTTHTSAIQRSFYSTSGDHAADLAATAFTNSTGNWYYVTDVEVQSNQLRGTLVALGDSITAGAHSTGNANHRWPNYLADRLLQLPVNQQFGVLDEGISGNQILTDGANVAPGPYSGVSALHRLKRDVFGHGDVKVLILLEGINDIKGGATSDDIIVGLKQVATLAHAQGIRVLVGTLTPFGGSSGYTAQRETYRENVNAFIRANIGGMGSSVFDGMIDFEAAVRDPHHPLQLLLAYDGGDHLHLNDQGYQAMGNAINLAQL